jgi:hypothetical protein
MLDRSAPIAQWEIASSTDGVYTCEAARRLLVEKEKEKARQQATEDPPAEIPPPQNVDRVTWEKVRAKAQEMGQEMVLEIVMDRSRLANALCVRSDDPRLRP